MNFLDIVNEGKRIVYYENSNCQNIDIFNNPEQYIKTYFNDGNKITILFTKESPLLQDKKRCIHMCSLYAFGAYLSKETMINEIIEKKYRYLVPKSLKKSYINSYLYYWFLVSLFHDVGYGLNIVPKLKYNLFNHLRSQCTFISDILSKTILNQQEGKIHKLFNSYSDKRFKPNNFISSKIDASKQNILHNKRFNPNTYYRDYVYNKYLKLDNLRIISEKNQSNSNEYFEHGILGGKLLYNNFLIAFRDSIIYNLKVTNDYIIGSNNLIWFPEQIDIIRDLGYIVATHNMWKDNFDKYMINSRFRKISIDNPVLFLLCLCDTIDPFKYLMKRTDKLDEITEILQQINLNISEKTINIYSPVIDKLDIKKTWYNGLKENLESFLKVEVIVNNDSTTILL